jgi:hypothetical protein
MDWNPKHWDWAPRVDEGVAWLCRNIPRAAIYALKAIFNIDRWNLRGFWTGLGWLPRNYVKLLSILFLILLPFWGWLIIQVWQEIYTLTGGTIPTPISDDHRNIAYALGVTITALAGLLVAPLILIRTWVSERNATTAEQGLITDRITRAVEQLGAEKTVRRREFKPLFKVDAKGKWTRDTDGNPVPATRPDGTPLGEYESVEETVPNLEVRLGAIYALERIAQDSERDYSVILEILCAYIRSNAPSSSAHEIKIENDTHPALLTTNIKKELSKISPPRIDVQAAMVVIGRRNLLFDKPFSLKLDLRFCNLQNINLQRLNYHGAMVSGSKFDGATFIDCNLDKLSGTPKEYNQSFKFDGDISVSHIHPTTMIRANIIGCSMTHATLLGCKFDGALIRKTDMNTSCFLGCSFRGVNFDHFSIAKCTIGCADLRFASGLEDSDLLNALGDRTTSYSNRLQTPQHWTDYAPLVADYDACYDAWQSWLAAGAPPGKPPEPPQG